MSGKNIDILKQFLGGADVDIDDTDLREVVKVEADEARTFVSGELDAGDLELGDEVSDLLVAFLVESKNIERLNVLATSGPKPLVKAARRGLHRLRAQGEDVTIGKPPSKQVERVVAASDQPEAWFAPPDGTGEKLVAIVAPAVGRGFHVIYVHMSDDRGLVDVIAGVGPKRAWRDLKKRFEERKLLFAPVPVPFACHLVEQGYARTLELKRSPPRSFAGVRGLISQLRDGADFAEHPAVEEVAPVESLSSDEQRKLHDLPELKSWTLPRDQIQPLFQKMEEIVSSEVIVSEEQRRDAKRDAIEAAATSFFDATTVAHWRERLLDAAYVYHRAGRKDDGARLRAQADRFAGDVSPLEEPFLMHSIEKLIPNYNSVDVSATADGPGDEPLIVRP